MILASRLKNDVALSQRLSRHFVVEIRRTLEATWHSVCVPCSRLVYNKCQLQIWKNTPTEVHVVYRTPYIARFSLCIHLDVQPGFATLEHPTKAVCTQNTFINRRWPSWERFRSKNRAWSTTCGTVASLESSRFYCPPWIATARRSRTRSIHMTPTATW